MDKNERRAARAASKMVRRTSRYKKSTKWQPVIKGSRTIGYIRRDYRLSYDRQWRAMVGADIVAECSTSDRAVQAILDHYEAMSDG